MIIGVPPTPTFMSSAERATLQAKEDKGNIPPRTSVQWGCGGSHSWYGRVNERIFFPKGSDPESIQHAASKYNQLLGKMKQTNDKKKFAKAIYEITKATASTLSDGNVTFFEQFMQAQ